MGVYSFCASETEGKKQNYLAYLYDRKPIYWLRKDREVHHGGRRCAHECRRNHPPTDGTGAVYLHQQHENLQDSWCKLYPVCQHRLV